VFLPLKRLLIPALALLSLAGASSASAAGGTGLQSSATPATPVNTASTGGAGIGAPAEPASTPEHPTVPGAVAKIIKGVAYAPSFAPMQVKKAIWAGNQIRLKPYEVGGGHGKWHDSAYDCSGSVSYLLHAAGLLKVSEDSGEMESWGQKGLGQWITVYTNPGHAFIQVAGIRMDTSREGDPNPPPGTGPRWRPVMTSTSGYVARHPSDL
jgi:cell wall-associated NlpC family hydrolase